MDKPVAEVPIDGRIVAVRTKQRLELAQVSTEVLAPHRAVFPTRVRFRPAGNVSGGAQPRLAQVPKPHLRLPVPQQYPGIALLFVMGHELACFLDRSVEVLISELRDQPAAPRRQ